MTEASHAGLGALREQVTDAEESPQRPVPGLAWDKLPMPTSPLLASLRGTLRAWGKERKSILLKREMGGVQASWRKHHWILCLKGFYLFSKGRRFRAGY